VPPIRIVLADDHGVVRAGLRLLLDAEPDFEVVAEAADTDSILDAVLSHKPDVLVLDLNMPGEQSLPERLSRVLDRSPETRTVILTMQDDAGSVREALRAGALGYVLKDAADAELAVAGHRAALGETHLGPALGARLATAPEAPAGPPGGLSEREAQILGLIALGHTNAEVAAHLTLSVRTVEAHRSHVQQKLGLSTRAELVRYALDHGLLDGA
jgi:two-component system response regulator NreC